MAVGRVDVEELQKSLEKRGYVHEGGRKFAMGDLETVVVKGKLGDAVTAVTVVRPTAKPKHDRFALASPESKLESFRKTGAGLLDGGIVIGVEVEGDQAKARALLDDLVDGPPRQNLSPGG
ncbi:MAG: hypothetical protein R3B72_11580 [Polyangiaceae bacterium]